MINISEHRRDLQPAVHKTLKRLSTPKQLVMNPGACES